jgi:hypothetical protein
MENLKSVLAAIIQSWKPFAIVGGVCLVAGIAIGVML